MTKTLMGVEEASHLIRSGARLLIAGEDHLLAALPKGDWIGGTTPYLMTEEGYLCSRDQLQAIALPSTVQFVKAHMYSAQNLKLIPKDYVSNGFAVILVPGGSEAHTTFAKDSSSWPDVFAQPLVGWVAGRHLDEGGQQRPRVYNGQSGESSDAKAVVLHISLPGHLAARMNTVNLFQTGTGDAISFPTGGLEVTECIVHGEHCDFVEYLAEHGIDTSIPLVANYFGALVNVSLNTIDKASGKVSFFAPVFPGVHYRFAAPIADYEAAYEARMTINQLWAGDPIYACTCILNYRDARLEGKKNCKMIGPVVFGEIAYMLLNQTMVYITLEPK